ncbi:hypothetical protein K458DRAFT_434246 [Lentithecium fluviatile CBS 122367]|uniref:Uncharacterized protein n=1 Tax=Lentithecium fluviatile CBS 122367 TaxID=1168545 RepID=A0A6G1IQZ3_9PLEO|nr:hypothetical protein K458DRAFT_434246 [Lentithecium fluviatile CBS 122367]
MTCSPVPARTAALPTTTRRRRVRTDNCANRRPQSLPRKWAPKTIRRKRNVQATLLGLPRALRLKIYSYIFRSVLIHVRRRPTEASRVSPPFSWSACRAPLEDAMLCAQSTCSDDGSIEAVGSIAFMTTSRAIYQEARRIIFESATIAINIQDIIDVA